MTVCGQLAEWTGLHDFSLFGILVVLSFEEIFFGKFLFAEVMLYLPLFITLLNLVDELEMVLSEGEKNVCEFLVSLLGGRLAVREESIALFLYFLAHPLRLPIEIIRITNAETH